MRVGSHRQPARDEYVVVTCSADHDPREIFMVWLGSNKFSGEYTSREWSTRTRYYYEGKGAAAIIHAYEKPQTTPALLTCEVHGITDCTICLR